MEQRQPDTDKHNKPIITAKRQSSSVAKSGTTQPAVRAERQRSPYPMIAFTLIVLLALVVVPFMILRPQTSVYRLLSWTGATVTTRTISQTVSSSGVVVAQDTREVSARSAGTLDSLEVREGDDVRVGQVIARLNAPDLEKSRRDAQTSLTAAQTTAERTALEDAGAVQKARSALEGARQAVQPLETEWRDAAALFKLGGETRRTVEAALQKLEDARRSVNAASAAVSAAEALQTLNARTNARAVSAAQDDLARAVENGGRAVVRSPISGRVVSVDGRVGQELRGGDRVATVTSLERLRVDGLVDESSAANVKAGQSVRVTIDDAPYKGQVSRVASQVVKGERSSTVKVAVALLTRPKPLLPNTSANLEITVGTRKNVASLPRGAYLSTGGELLVYVLSADGQSATRRQARFGASDAEHIEILGGLEPGERIVTSSYEAFKDQPQIEIAASGEIK